MAGSRCDPANTFLSGMRDNPSVRGWIALGLVYFCWSSTYLAIRIGVENMPPLSMAAARFLLPGGVLYVATWRQTRRRATGRQWLSAVVIGVLLMAGGNGGVTLGEQTVPSGIASLLIATVPFWMVLIDAVKERRLVSPLVVTGLVVGFGGMLLLLRPSPGHAVDPLGAAFVLGAGFVWAVGSIWSRTAPQAQPPLRAIGMSMLAGGVTLASLAVATGELPRLHWTVSGGLAILWLSVIGSLVGFSAYLYALRVLPAATVSTYAFVNPILAVLLGAVVLQEPVTPQTVGAMVVTVAGVALIVVARARRG